MRKKSLFAILSLVFIGLIFSGASSNKQAVSKTQVLSQENSQKSKLAVDINFGKMPLYFIENRGQVDQLARFYAKASRYTLWLTEKGLVFDSTRRIGDKKQKDITTKELFKKDQRSSYLPEDPLDSSIRYQREVTRLKFVGANPHPMMVPFEEQKLKVNYFKGNDPAKWNCDVPTSKGVIYQNIYPGIDLKVYGIEKEIEYDWLVKPHANPEDIRFEYQNVNSTQIDQEGHLVVETEFGEMIHKKPESYQPEDDETGNSISSVGTRSRVEVKFKKFSKNIYGFEVGEYDRNRELIIDPLVIPYSTYLGGSSDDLGYGIACDSSGNAYVTGYTYSSYFPILKQYQWDQTGADAFVTRIDTTQSGSSSLVYCTYLGGSGSDYGRGIAVDNSGNAYVTGYTYSTDFPTLNQYQGDQTGADVFVTRIDTTLWGSSSLIYSTYLGGDGSDEGYDIAAESSGIIYVTGKTASTNFPTACGYQTDQPGWDAFFTKIDTSPSALYSLIYSTYLGGDGSDIGYGIAEDGSGGAYVTGLTWSTDFPCLNEFMGYPGDGYYDASMNWIQYSNAFVTKFNTNEGSFALLYSTYLGGDNDETDWIDIAVESANVYVTGATISTDFPTKNQYQGDQTGSDAFVTRIDTTLSGSSCLVYSTYLGGNGSDTGYGIAVDTSGLAYVTGHTSSTNFPSFYWGVQTGWDAFVSRIDSNLSGSASLICSTYLGGSDNDFGYGIAIDSNGNAYVAGYTYSTDFLTVNQYQGNQTGSDAFVTKLSCDDIDVISPNGGESWDVGTLQEITWTSIGPISNVKIEYSTNNGSNWTTEIASTSNDGSYSWTIPSSPSTQCLVRISDADDGIPSDASDAVFTIFITVLTPPTVTTGAASDVTTNSATLNGTVNPNGKSTDYHFEYGLNTSYGTVTTTQSAGAGSMDVPVSEPVSGLSSNTDYHYHLVANNADGTTYGEDQTFTTGTTIKTWSGINRLTWNSGDSCLPSIAVDPSNNVHIFWHDLSPGNNEIMYKKSTDEGSTWGALNRITWNSGSSKKPVVAADTSSNVHMAWYDDSNGNYEIFYKKSTNSGSTWGPIKRMTWNTGASVNPTLALSSGYVHLIWNDLSTGNDEIIYKRSTDGGSTWGPLNRLTWNGGDSKSPAITADTSNNVYVAWYDNTYGNDEILYKRSTDGGSTWGGISRITWNGGSSAMPYLAVNSTSGVYLVWNDDSSGNNEILFKRSTDGGTTWGAIQRATWNVGASLKPVVAVDSGNNVHIAWYDDTPGNYEIYYKQSTDGGSTWGALFRVTWNAGSSAAPSIAVDASGNVYLTWEDNTSGNFEIYNKNKK